MTQPEKRTYAVQVVVRETTIEEVLVDAESEAEALRLVNEYETDEEFTFIESVECTHEAVSAKPA